MSRRTHFVLRSTGGENRNSRPDFYDKDSCLSSLVQAVRSIGESVGDVIFVNDGPLPKHREKVMRAEGEVIQLPGVGNSRSHRVAMGLLDSRGWSDDDWFVVAEDDHVWHPDAFVVHEWCMESRIELVSYYDAPDYTRLRDHQAFSRRHRNTLVDPNGTTWRPVRSGVMSFGGRVGALRTITWLHWLGTRGPVPGDYDCWSTVSRVGPTRIIRALSDSPSMRDATIIRRAVGRFAGRARADLLMYAPQPSLSTHMQDGEMAAGQDWRSLVLSLPRLGGS